jgi:hypothetical protein
MNTPIENPNTVENSAYNPFPEPQTIPSGWDLSEMLIRPQDETVVSETETVKGIQVNK